MKKVTFYSIALIAGFLSLAAALVMVFTGNLKQAGPFFILFFAITGIGFRGYPHLKGFTYTISIFAALTAALYYPHIFVAVGGYKLSNLIKPLLMIIMFGMGTSMSLDDFVGVVKMPKGVLIGVCSHFMIMPLVGFTLASVSGFPPEIAAGMILVGCSPNGMASNVVSYLAKANLGFIGDHNSGIYIAGPYHDTVINEATGRLAGAC